MSCAASLQANAVHKAPDLCAGMKCVEAKSLWVETKSLWEEMEVSVEHDDCEKS